MLVTKEQKKKQRENLYLIKISKFINNFWPFISEKIIFQHDVKYSEKLLNAYENVCNIRCALKLIKYSIIIMMRKVLL